MLRIPQGQERLGLHPGGHHSIRETIRGSAKPSVWEGKASCLAEQEGQLRKQGKEGPWEEMALSSGLSDKQLLGVVSPRCGQRTSLACYFMSKVMCP